ncbi:MAG: DUF3810 domain-containing protein [Urechidicola sp.]
MMKNNKLYRLLSVFLVIQWVFIQIISRYPNGIEKYYSRGIYPFISSFFRILFGWIPFSIGDVLYIVLAILVIKSIIGCVKNRRINFLQILATISVFYFCFYFFWGLNYYRSPLHKSLEIKELNYTTDELETFTYQMIEKVNHLQKEIMQNDTLKVEIPFDKTEIYTKVQNGYKNLALLYPELTYKTKSIKHSIISLPMTYLGTSGYLNPFTNEAQVNSLNPIVVYPSTSSHEVAHQLGYAAENEANFIGFLAAIYNDDLYFQYSGYYIALRYTLKDLHRQDNEKYLSAIKTLNKGTRKNMKDNYEFWNSYKNSIEPYTKMLFDQFLKANKQKDGIKSYSRMVGMLINYNKQNDAVFKLLK